MTPKHSTGSAVTMPISGLTCRTLIKTTMHAALHRHAWRESFDGAIAAADGVGFSSARRNSYRRGLGGAVAFVTAKPWVVGSRRILRAAAIRMGHGGRIPVAHPQ